jgi:DNA topoisomerase IB
LGNTRAVCRSSYVSPDVLDAHATGALAAAAAAHRSSRWLDRAERAVIDVLPPPA